MPFFQYQAKNSEGKIFSDKIEAQDQTVAVNALVAKGLMITSIKQMEEEKPVMDTDLNFFNKRVSGETLSTFMIQLSIMIKCGVNLAEALQSLEHGEENPTFKACISDIRSRVYNGASLSEALSYHLDVFDKFTVAMIRVGETGGVLEQVLVKLAASSKRRQQLKGQILGALAYPCVLLLVATIVLIILMGFAVPRFAELFAKAGLELPLATKILIETSTFVSNHIWGIIIAMVIALILFIYYAVTEDGRNNLGEISLLIPVLKNVTKRFFVVQISESMGLLLGAGVPLRELLIAIENTQTMPTPKATVAKMRDFIDQGSNLKSALENDPIFPPMAVKLIETGETTGTIDSMFNEIAAYYDEQLNAAIKAALSVMEPCLIACMAVLVGFIMIAVFIPLFKMSFIRPK